jgi:serine/threonine-protein kinase
MKPAWEQVRALFEEVCDLPAAQREERLARQGAVEPELCAEVESLLACSERAPQFLSTTAIGRLSGAQAGDPQGLIGSSVGAYRILRPIASGGMGAVYLATRSDGSFSRQAAIKIIKQDFVGVQRRRRFDSERRTLARLDHPFIARLIDGGVSKQGLQFLIMEYVDGRPIEQYCDQQLLTTAARLELFCKVCAAVAHAHRQFIVHRDIKPGNILVTADGTPKLLDFGISKVLDPDGAEAGEITATAGRLMTLGYASPEQIRGEPVTAASDVYSLGVVLYELLAGRRPHQPQDGSLMAAERAICSQEPERPSVALFRKTAALSGNPLEATPEAISRWRRTHPDRLARRLSGDLDAIVMMAIRPEPQRRYASVDHLAEDIDRHLRGLPVRARAGTRRYRAGKFVRRHAVVLAAALLLAGSLVAGLQATLWQARIAGQQRDGALAAQAASEAEARKAGEVLGFVRHMIAAASPRGQGRDLTVVAALAQAAEHIDQDRELAGQPLVEAAVRTVIGTTYHGLGEYSAAEPHLVSALAVRRQHLVPDHPELVESMVELGSLQTSLGWYDQAEPLLREAVDIERGRPRAHAGDLSRALSRLGKLVQLRGDLAAAEELRREELSLRRSLAAGADSETASSLINLASVLQMQGRLEEAEPLYLEARDMYGVLLGPDHSDLSDVLNNLGSLKKAQGHLEESAELFREALRIRRVALGPDHPNVARTLSNLGSVLLQLGQLQEAEGLQREALAIRRLGLGDNHPDTARSRHRLAEVLMREGRAEEAEPLLEEAAAVLASALSPGHRDVAAAGCAHADCLRRLAKYEEAERTLLGLHGQLSITAEPDRRSADTIAKHLVDLYAEWGRPEEARRWQSGGSGSAGP